MEFWGVEVKSGKPLKVSPGDGMVLHLSQANIGELKKGHGTESVCLFMNVDRSKYVIGTLFTDKIPQQQFDLVFEKDFELSHNWKNGSVYFYGYRASKNPYEEGDLSDGEFGDSESEGIPVNLAKNGKHESKSKEQKPAEAENCKIGKEKASRAGKQKLLTPEIKNEGGDSVSEDDEEVKSEDEDNETSVSEGGSSKKAETSKKRLVEPASKTPVSEKKPKATPQRTDGKKGNVHVDTPYPSKPAGKTPKPGGSVTCKRCNRRFLDELALQSHSLAKHGGKK